MFKRSFIIFSALLTSSVIFAQSTAQNPPVRLRGTIEKIDVGSITIKERRGETITLALPENLAMSEVYPINLADIKAGSFIGTAAIPKADGSQEALEVLVFPEAMRGTGEGHYPWDLQPDSTMTNATVADLAVAPQGRTLRVKYKGGEKTIHVAEGSPIVTFRPAEKNLLVIGAKILVTAVERDGKPTITRMTIGRNGFAPPM